MEAEVAADEPGTRAVRQAGPLEELRGVERARGDDHRACVHAPKRPVAVGVLDAPGLTLLDDDPLHGRLGAQLELAGRPGVVDVRVHGRLARVGRAALEARAAAHAVRVRVRVHRLEVGAERAEPGLDRVDALAPVRPHADAEPPLDAVVVRLEVRRAERQAARADEPARLVPLREVVFAGAQRHLRVDRGRPADAPGGQERDDAAGAAVDRREPQRPPEVVVRLRLPTREVGRGAVRACLQEEHAPAAVGELTGDDPAARARPDHHDVESLERAHEIPRYDQSFFRRVASGVEKSISSQAPCAPTPGATKSL